MDARMHVVPTTQPEVAEAPQSFEDFFQDHHAQLFAALCLTSGSRDEAEEIMQDAFLRLWERWDRVSAMEDATGFLFRTAMNTFLKRYRRARLAIRHVLPIPESDDAFATVNDRDVLVRAMRDLTPHQRAAVVLTSILDYSSEEAGRILGLKDSTVRVLARNARVAMRLKVGDPT